MPRCLVLCSRSGRVDWACTAERCEVLEDEKDEVSSSSDVGRVLPAIIANSWLSLTFLALQSPKSGSTLSLIACDSHISGFQSTANHPRKSFHGPRRTYEVEVPPTLRYIANKALVDCTLLTGLKLMPGKRTTWRGPHAEHSAFDLCHRFVIPN